MYQIPKKIADLVESAPGGCYQEGLLRGPGRACWSGADLKGKASNYGAHYARSRDGMLGNVRRALGTTEWSADVVSALISATRRWTNVLSLRRDPWPEGIERLWLGGLLANRVEIPSRLVNPRAKLRQRDLAPVLNYPEALRCVAEIRGWGAVLDALGAEILSVDSVGAGPDGTEIHRALYRIPSDRPYTLLLTQDGSTGRVYGLAGTASARTPEQAHNERIPLALTDSDIWAQA